MKKLITLLLLCLTLAGYNQNQNSQLAAKLLLSVGEPLPGAAITSGTPTSGVTYTMGHVGASSDFSASGAPSTANGVTFKADGDAPGAWDGAILRPINASALTLPDPAYTMTNTGAIPTYGHKGGSSYLAFDGVNDTLTIAFTTASSSFVIWIRPTVTNKLWINMGTNMTIGIDGSNALALGSSLTNPTTYIYDGNGAALASVALNQWNYIVIKSDAITPTTLQFGYVSSSYGAFDLQGFQAFNYGADQTFATYYSNPANHLKAVDQGATGTEMLTGDNSTFASDTGWWTIDGATITSGVLRLSSVGGKNVLFKEAYGITLLTIGEWYSVKFKISNSTGTSGIYLGSSFDTGEVAYKVDGTYSLTIKATSTNITVYAPPTVTLDFDDFTITRAGCILSITPESFISPTLIRDWYHSVDIALSGATAPRLVRGSLTAWRMIGSTYLSLTDASAPQMNGDKSVSFWFNPTIIDASQYIFSNGKLQIGINATGAKLKLTSDGSTTINSTASSIAISTWYQVVITRTSTGTANVYINGVLSGTGATGTPAEGSTDFRIGYDGSVYFTGIIEKPLFYDRILSAEDIYLFYNSVQPIYLD